MISPLYLSLFASHLLLPAVYNDQICSFGLAGLSAFRPVFLLMGDEITADLKLPPAWLTGHVYAQYEGEYITKMLRVSIKIYMNGTFKKKTNNGKKPLTSYFNNHLVDRLL